MKLIKQSYEILTPISEGGIEELRKIELAARTCYKSEDKISPDGKSAQTLVKSLINRGHEAMLEHSQLSVKFITDRGTSHEIVRHRMASFAQESTRYCNYGKDKFGNELTFIFPDWLDVEYDNSYHVAWHEMMEIIEMSYLSMINHGVSPEKARDVLPNALKTEIVVTANYREWRHIFNLRCAPAAHPQIRSLMTGLRDDLRQRIPIIFDCEDKNDVFSNIDSKSKTYKIPGNDLEYPIAIDI